MTDAIDCTALTLGQPATLSSNADLLAHIIPTSDGLTVVVRANARLGLDRRDVMAWGFGFSHRHRDIAIRLRSAIAAGAVLSNFRVCTDVHGKTYLSADTAVIGRRMNADLRRLGF